MFYLFYHNNDTIYKATNRYKQTNTHDVYFKTRGFVNSYTPFVSVHMLLTLFCTANKGVLSFKSVE